MLTARLPLALETQLNHYAAANAVSKSYVVQEAVRDYLQHRQSKASPHTPASDVRSGDAFVPHALPPAERLLALGLELDKKYPGADIDWRAARDEGRK